MATNKINDPLGKNVVLHDQFIIILPLHALNNKNTPVASSAKRVISKCSIISIATEDFEKLLTLHTTSLQGYLQFVLVSLKTSYT